MNLLQDFKTKPFIVAAQSFFKNLNVPVNIISEYQTQPENIIGDKKCNEIITAIYPFGIVTDAIFNDLENKILLKNIDDYAGILLFGIELNFATPTRTQLADIVRVVNQQYSKTPVVIIFKYNSKLTFANAERIDYKQTWREGEKVGKVSMLKDIDLDKPHRAHQDILQDLGKHKSSSFDELYLYWQKVLNTKELNKKFFKKIANWYFWSVDKSKFPYEYLKIDAKNADKSNENLQELANQKATIRFITRMIFVWFLKEKKLIPANLFDQNYIKTIIKDFDNKNNSNYYNAILQNLFFATLNRRNDLRDFAVNKSFHENKSTFDMNSFFRYENLYLDENPAAIMQRFEAIPFINGGLFDCLDVKDNDLEKQIIDGFSRNKKWQANVPNYLFFENQNVDFNKELNQVYYTKTGKYEVKGLFEIFDEYKFTVEENTPLEIDVALDPYLLGEIFENLLAYYNPETGATARKGSGSFYTPQEIVNYMVDESLLAYLQPLVPNFDNFDQIQDFDHVQKLQVVTALATVKILDPACGSGAFPMGVLYKMVNILKTIDPDNSIWRQVQHDKIIGDQEKKLRNDDKILDTLSDEEVRTKAKKAVADKLLELENNFNKDYHFDDYSRKLYIIQHSIYGVDIQDVAIQISKLRFFLSLIIDQKNENIKPLPNLETKFVIANTLIGLEIDSNLANMIDYNDYLPTSDADKKFLNNTIAYDKEEYFDLTFIKNKLKENRNRHFESKDKKSKQIIERTDVLLRNLIFDGLINNGFPAAAATKLAKFNIFNQNAQAEWFDSDWMFGINNGFDIVIGNPPYVVTNKNSFINYKWNGDLYYLFFENSIEKLLKNNGILSFITPKFFLVNKNATLIRKYFLEEIEVINLVETNPFEDVVSENLISTIKKVKSSSDIIKIYKEKNGVISLFNEINKKYCLQNEFFEILTYINDITINVLNKVCYETNKLKHLSISKRGAEISKNELIENVSGLNILIGKDVHKYDINLTKSKIKENHKEYKRLIKFFNQENMIYLRRVSADLVCTISDINIAFSKNIYGIAPSKEYDKRYICSLLNSKCLNFYYKKRFSTKKEDVFPEIQTYLFEQLPIKEIPLTAQQPFIKLVDQILAEKKLGNNTSELEHQIDVMVYQLYDLTYDEAIVIDKNLTREDFER